MSYKQARGRLRPEGWLLEYLRRDAAGMTGNLDRIFPDAGCDIFAGERVEHLEDGYWSSWWPGEVRGNWMEGLVRLAFLLQDRTLLERAHHIVDGLLDAQEADGYMGIYKPGARYIVTKRFGELWTQSRVMRTLLVYYTYTGEQRVLAALVRLADNIIEHVTGSVFALADEDGSKGHSLMIIDGLHELYLLTGNTAYRAFCCKLYADYCAHPSEFMQDDLRMVNLMDPDKPFVGHGPHTCEALRLPLLLYSMTGEASYREAFDCAMTKLKRNLVLSGSCKSDEFIGTYQSALVMENTDRAGAFGGSIPLPSVGYEYCSTTELVLDYIQAELLTEEPDYADKMEWLLYNAGLASKHPSGKMIQYLGADNMYDASAAVNPRFDYSPTHEDAAGCCAANACRIMPAFASYAFLQKEDMLIANLYLPVCFTTTGGLHVQEKTEYPFGDRICFVCSGRGQTRFALRIPQHAGRFELQRNGSPAAYHLSGRLAVLDEALCAGDTLTLTLQTGTKLLRACDGTFAISRGTLLYARNIPAVRHIRRRYPQVRGFFDADYTPKLHENWDYTILTDADGGCAGARLETPETAGYPLDGACPRLRVRALDRYAYPIELELLPIAATTLRRTTFPVLCDQAGIYTAAMDTDR